jgi:hypothetical protein
MQRTRVSHRATRPLACARRVLCTDNAGKMSLGISAPANPAFISPLPLSITTGWFAKASISGRVLLTPPDVLEPPARDIGDGEERSGERLGACGREQTSRVDRWMRRGEMDGSIVERRSIWRTVYHTQTYVSASQETRHHHTTAADKSKSDRVCVCTRATAASRRPSNGHPARVVVWLVPLLPHRPAC